MAFKAYYKAFTKAHIKAKVMEDFTPALKLVSNAQTTGRVPAGTPAATLADRLSLSAGPALRTLSLAA